MLEDSLFHRAWTEKERKKGTLSRRRTQIFWHLMNGHMYIRRMKINGLCHYTLQCSTQCYTTLKTTQARGKNMQGFIKKTLSFGRIAVEFAVGQKEKRQKD